MTRQIDIQLFTQTTGGIEILAAVGQAFLIQLVPWRLAMEKHTERFDATELINLVHRMKGSCHVLAAPVAAAEFEAAEQRLKVMNAVNWRPDYQRLQALTQEIEADLQQVMLSQTQQQ